jgi:4-amino-4-deoxy-L-arabinose transferase-like glycosyltransferase
MNVDRIRLGVWNAIHEYDWAVRSTALAFSVLYVMLWLHDVTDLTAVQFGWYVDLQMLFVAALTTLTIAAWSSIAVDRVSARVRHVLDYAFVGMLALTVVLLFSHGGTDLVVFGRVVALLEDLGFYVFCVTTALSILVVESHRTRLGRSVYDSTDGSAGRTDGGWTTSVRGRTVEFDVYSVVAVGICLLFVLFAVQHLGRFLSVDEPKWLYRRVPELYEALGRTNWEQTYINDKPGVLPAVLAGLVNFVFDLETFGPHTIERYLFWWRAPITVFNAVMLGLFYRFSRQLVADAVAVLALGFVALNPIVIGLSQVVNPDATLWSVSMLSVLTFLLYLRTNAVKYAVYSGVFLGLALLSKYFAMILFVVYPLVAYVEYLFGPTRTGEFFDRIWHVYLCLGLGMAIYALLFPATWVSFDRLVRGTIGAPILESGRRWLLLVVALVVVELTLLDGRVSRRIGIEWGTRAEADGGRPHTRFLGGAVDVEAFVRQSLVMVSFGLVVLLLLNATIGFPLIDPSEFLWGIYDRGGERAIPTLLTSLYVTLYALPLPLLGAIGVTLVLFSAGRYDDFHRLLIYACLLLLVVFVLGSAVGGYITIPRYQSLLYPVYALLGALAIVRVDEEQRRVLVAVLLLALVVVSVFAAPFYLHHTNGLNTEDVVVSDPWGYGGYELAQQMNRLNERTASEIVVWTDREGFSVFYDGPSYFRGATGPYTTNKQVDYLVLSKGGKRIFTYAKHDWNQGDTYMYARLVGTTDLFEYYSKAPRMRVCLNQRTNCVRAVPFDETNAAAPNETLVSAPATATSRPPSPRSARITRRSEGPPRRLSGTPGYCTLR